MLTRSKWMGGRHEKKSRDTRKLLSDSDTAADTCCTKARGLREGFPLPILPPLTTSFVSSTYYIDCLALSPHRSLTLRGPHAICPLQILNGTPAVSEPTRTHLSSTPTVSKHLFLGWITYITSPVVVSPELDFYALRFGSQKRGCYLGR